MVTKEVIADGCVNVKPNIDAGQAPLASDTVTVYAPGTKPDSTATEPPLDQT